MMGRYIHKKLIIIREEDFDKAENTLTFNIKTLLKCELC